MLPSPSRGRRRPHYSPMAQNAIAGEMGICEKRTDFHSPNWPPFPSTPWGERPATPISRGSVPPRDQVPPLPPPHNPSTDPPPPTLHHQFAPRLIPHFFQPHASLAPPTPFSTTLGHALGPRTGAAHGGPEPRTELCSRDVSFAVARTATPPLLSYGPERDRGRDEHLREKDGLHSPNWPPFPSTPWEAQRETGDQRVRRGSTGRRAAVPQHGESTVEQYGPGLQQRRVKVCVGLF